jgi:hypothetical protein
LRYERYILYGELPPDVRVVGWDAVKAGTDKEIPVDGTYSLSWDSIRLPEMRLTTRVSLKTRPTPRLHPANTET